MKGCFSGLLAVEIGIEDVMVLSCLNISVGIILPCPSQVNFNKYLELF